MKRVFGSALLAAVLFTPFSLFAHCDSVAGPVAKDVALALQSGQLDPVLKWIRVADERELRTAFEGALSVRKAGGESATLADQYFLETAVRLHRASEGEPYTGLKPEHAAKERIPFEVDSALTNDSFGPIKEAMLSDLKVELTRRIEALRAAAKTKDSNPDRGREFVRAYVSAVHYLEALESFARSRPENDHHDGE